ncbi:MAG TPA: vWA domain-containing protein, partial [Planctomycetota bacterium]|nr:vWA domain-containing protein [Planctomycetota bacterium]
RYTPEAAQVALAIANNGDNMGVVTFSNGATSVLPMQTVQGFAARTKIQADMQDLAKYRAGGTNYSAALNRTREMLDAAHANHNANSNVVFLTDGKPDDLPEEIDKAVTPFIDANWRINTIGLTMESDNDSLGRMQALTRGMKKVVLAAPDLLEAYLRIALSVNNYWEFSHAANNSPIILLPGAKRLIYIGVRDRENPDADLAGVLNHGKTVDMAGLGEKVFRYPPAGAGWKTNYEVINMENPESGVYQPYIPNGGVDIFKVMMEPPYDFDFASATPPPVFYGGDPMEIVAVVRSSTPEGLDYFEKMGEIGMSATFDNDSAIIAPYTTFTEHSRQTIDGNQVLVYKHTFNFDTEALGQKDRNVRLTLVGKVRASDTSEGLWTSERNALIQYRPGDKIHPLVFQPAKNNLGDVWSDATPKVSCELRAVHAEQLSYSLTAEPKSAVVKFDPAAGTLKFEESKTITIMPDYNNAPVGPQAIRITATPAALNANLAAEAVVVNASVYKLVVKPIAMSNVRPGQLARSTQPLSITLTPDVKFAMHFEANRPEAGGILKVVEKDGQYWLEGTIPETAAGDIGGSLVVTVPDTSLEPKKFPVPVSLNAQAPAFTEVKGLSDREGRSALHLDAPNAGVAAGALTFTPKDAVGAELKVALVSLSDRNNNELFKATGEVPALRYTLPTDIDPQHLADGKPIDLKYNVFVSSDIPPETYQGKLVLQLVRDGKTVLSRDIPIEVHVGAGR